jgi:NAD(P)-dependent dehydrogenase (short-subunit alcohol dehydrogenase family)
MTKGLHFVNARIAVITGAADGLGRATAVRLAQDGFDIVAADISTSSETIAAVMASGRRALEVRCDVSSGESVDLLAAAVADFGGADVLVNNAGVYPFVLFKDLTPTEWRRIFSINLDGMYFTCRALLPQMQEKGWGRVINIASNSFINGADPMLAGYVSSKGGIIGLTRALGSEYGEFGITVNAVAPGLLVTGTTTALIGAPGTQGADDAGYMTAQTLVVDGGLARV